MIIFFLFLSFLRAICWHWRRLFLVLHGFNFRHLYGFHSQFCLVASKFIYFECEARYIVDLKIFVVKIFSWFAQTTKIKNTKYILQWIIIIARTFLFTAQLPSYFARDSLFDTSMSLELMANA